MIIVADSGGSKIDWRFLKTDRTIAQANSPGFNPYYQPIDHLKKIIKESLLPQINEPVTKIFYYGTGVSSEKNQQLIQLAFVEHFGAAKIEIGWDLLAAARALCGQEAGIACILGTGSNSCQYDGKEIVENVANLGWILADEGSGSCLGKQIVFDYFRKNMPETLATQFHARFPWTREEVLEKVYQQEKPSAFLASFAKFIFQHLKEPYCYKLVYKSFSDFYENNVMKYPDYKKLKVHFTGSIAFYFSDVLRQVANDKGITVKNILEGPIAGLTLYHQKDL
ncbi:MAG: N-acetylglucosamine kinase [Cytophagales bacterium]|jgi:N-acetylglucosamine kinase-like BadF-type ATPase|nr:N-acetylglucosamine kinase [Cytophagales bacterium]MCA6365918.1 N-acetylglucosamine kinase [Cytophagales bacterium]MCA6371314.1 N-acetylglucosamine kinase [Cytophagales bacterium]MCA6374919.1 N-acetylglucosamine kinase [Cytophagales bacterium]MCA6382773.1 N-acetylglucosamine kinase [Cytophagales bacterium]